MFSTFDDLKREVEESGGLMRVLMQDLRLLVGAGKLGVHVRYEISRQLAQVGLGHLPAELPTYQTDEVRVYSLGSRVADLIKAVLDPTELGDRILQEAGSDDAADKLDQIRRLLCDE